MVLFSPIKSRTTRLPHGWWRRETRQVGPGKLRPRNRRSLPKSAATLQTQLTHKAFPLQGAPGERTRPFHPFLPKDQQEVMTQTWWGKRSKQFRLSVINFSPSALQIDYVHYLFERRLEPSSLNTSLCHEWLSLKKDFTVLNVRRPEQKCVWAAYRTSHSLSQPTLTPSTYRWCFIVLSIYLTQHWTLVNHINIFLKRIKTPKYLWHSCNQSLKTIQQMYIHFPWYV